MSGPAADGQTSRRSPSPSVTARPTSIEDLADVLRSTTATHPAVTVIGAGTKQHLGNPPTALDLAIDTRALTGVVEYNPGDLVLRARAGTSMGHLRQVAAEHGQQLALDVADAETLGGVVAANLSGPRRRRYGAVRDLLIGVRFVLADGRIATSGGRVVKNVAGYDLGKLMTGSLGTLAVLAELTVRLHPGPGSRSVVEMDAELVALSELSRWALRTQHDLAALEYRADLSGTGQVVATVEGPEAVVAATSERLLAELPGSRTRPPVEDELEVRSGIGPDAGSESALLLRVAIAPSGVPAVAAGIAGLSPALTGEQSWQLGLGLGTVQLFGPEDALAAALTQLRVTAHELDGSVVVTDASPGVRAVVDVWGPLRGGELMRGIKSRFDPGNRLAPGRMFGGAG